MTLIIDGVDIMPYIAQGGIKISRKDVLGPNAGSASNGRTWRDRRARKKHLDCTCRMLTSEEAQTVLSTISSEYVTVTYTDNQFGDRTCMMYSDNEPAATPVLRNGEDYWIGIAFPLEEV